MKNAPRYFAVHPCSLSAALIAVAAAVPVPTAPAQSSPDPSAPVRELRMADALPEGRNRFGLSARFGFNIQAKFRNKSGAPGFTDIGPATGPAVDRYYDDGFVGVDSTGNATGNTAYWSYQNLAQVTSAGIDYHSASPVSGASSSADADVAPGLELTYSRDLGEWGCARWGFDLGLGFNNITVEDDAPYSGSLALTTDTYNHPLGLGLSGAVPPNTPVSRTDVNIGRPVLPGAPSQRVVTTPTGTQTGWRELDANLFSLRLGPALNFPITQRFSAQVGLGLALGIVDSEFTLHEDVTTAAGGTAQNHGSDTDTGFLVGGYVGVSANNALTRRLSAFAEAQYQYLTDFTHEYAGREAELDLSRSIFVQGGLSFSF